MSNPRPPRPVTRMTVLRTEWLSPDLLRVVAGGAGIEHFAAKEACTDSYVKILFAPDGSVLREPLETLPAPGEGDSAQRPLTRTYTVRRFDRDAGELWIDFVIHGDDGVAGPWAATARPGDLLQLAGPGGAWAPPADADFHLFVGDESAVPAIAAGLEALPVDSRGLALIEAHRQEIELHHPSRVEVRWLVRGDAAYDEGRLARELSLVPWPEGVMSVFAHGERGAMKQLRRLFTERGVPRERLSLSGYWARGRVEQVFQQEKRTEIGRI